MTPQTWPCPLPGGETAQEYALAFDKERTGRLLIVPALFDEANRMRRLTVETMRRLDAAGIDSMLPDLPGTNESLQPLLGQTIDGWKTAVRSAVSHFGATHVLGVRGGCLLVPDMLPGWLYAPVRGANILRQMMRARILVSREIGREESRSELVSLAETGGITLAGYDLGADLFAGLNALEPTASSVLTAIEQETVGGSGLWMRAEPSESANQADALAARIAIGIRQ